MVAERMSYEEEMEMHLSLAEQLDSHAGSGDYGEEFSEILKFSSISIRYLVKMLKLNVKMVAKVCGRLGMDENEIKSIIEYSLNEINPELD